MTRTELLEIVGNGENSEIEFKRDDAMPHELAREISALLNFGGGHVLLGVEDNGQITGLTRDCKATERWALEAVCDNVQPKFIPIWSCMQDSEGRFVGIISIPKDSPSKPYKARQPNRSWVTYIRHGSTSRVASHEEELQLHQSRRLMRYDRKPVPGTDIQDLDFERIANYFSVIQARRMPTLEKMSIWRQVLLGIGMLADIDGISVPTVAGLLLFGVNPNRRLPQAGITAAAFPSLEKEDSTVGEECIRGPLVPTLSPRARVLDKGVIDRAISFLSRNMGTVAWLDSGRRRRRRAFPLDAVRESIVNAVAHRDYTLVSADIEISLYCDRLEVISPGRLPHRMTVEKMKIGARVARNELLRETLRDYGAIQHLGTGVPNRIIGSMRAHNGTEPDLIEEDDRFIVRLWKQRDRESEVPGTDRGEA